MRRRGFLRLATGAAATAVLGGCATLQNRPRVVVVGGGFGGATAAKYLRLWDSGIDVVMIEREAGFTSCPISNLVLGGVRRMEEIRHSHAGLARHGVQVVHDEALAIDTGRRKVRLANGSEIAYDRVIVSPGIDFLFDEIEGYPRESAGAVLHAWKAGEQTVELRRRLEQMPDGGVYVLSVPPSPYRCPPGPYERACQVAGYFKRAKPRAKVLVLDANPDVTSKGGLFKAAWKDLYGGIVEYRPNARVVAVEARTQTARLEFETVRADVLNVVPPQTSGRIAHAAGLVTHNARWCDVDWRTMESKAVKHVHVLGDATLSAPGMPKSGHMANAHAKVCAAAIIDLIRGRAVADPVLNNACYSFVSEREVIHVASVHQWDEAQKTVVPVKGSGGVSPARSALEAEYGWSWARNIWADMLA